MDLLAWLFFGLGSPVSCVFSLAGSSTRSICRVRMLCEFEDLISKNTKAPSLFPNHRENDHLVPPALGTPCASRSINPVAICYQVVPALMPLCQPQLQKIKCSRILMDGNGCRNAFLCFFSMRMKGPGLAGAGNAALGCSFYWALCKKTQPPPALLSSLLLKGSRTDEK